MSGAPKIHCSWICSFLINSEKVISEYNFFLSSNLDRKVFISNGRLKCSGSSLFLKRRWGTGYHLRYSPWCMLECAGNVRVITVSLLTEVAPLVRSFWGSCVRTTPQLLSSLARMSDLRDCRHWEYTVITPRLWFPWWLSGKDSASNAGDADWIPGLGRSPGGGHGNPPQCSCLENPTDRGAWWATVHGVTKSRTWLSD